MSGAGKPRRRPGRPPSRPPAEPIKIEGVVSTPRREGLLFEYCHQVPAVFNRLDAILKKMSLEIVFFSFGRDRVVISAIDVVDGKEEEMYTDEDIKRARAKILCTIEGSTANRYYLDPSHRNHNFSIRREYLEPIFRAIDKTYSSITFFAELAEPSRFHIQLHDSYLEKLSSSELTVPSMSDASRSISDGLGAFAHSFLDMNLDLDFPVRFTLGAKALSKTVADAKRHPHVEKLRFAYRKTEGLTIHHHVASVCTYTESYRNAALIDLKASVPEGEIFSVMVRLADLCPVTEALKDDARIYCGRAENGLLFRVDRGQGIFVNIFIHTCER